MKMIGLILALRLYHQTIVIIVRFSKIARAFMAIGEDLTLANVTTSTIRSNSGDNQDPINATDSEEFTIGNLSQG
jgi:hypothetical protein